MCRPQWCRPPQRNKEKQQTLSESEATRSPATERERTVPTMRCCDHTHTNTRPQWDTARGRGNQRPPPTASFATFARPGWLSRRRQRASRARNASSEPRAQQRERTTRATAPAQQQQRWSHGRARAACAERQHQTACSRLLGSRCAVVRFRVSDVGQNAKYISVIMLPRAHSAGQHRTQRGPTVRLAIRSFECCAAELLAAHWAALPLTAAPPTQRAAAVVQRRRVMMRMTPLATRTHSG